ncbi:MAG: signal peptidase I [Myxococcaceae bacterium]|nr:signal peptidase I [Myxococcaceae bacterium]
MANDATAGAGAVKTLGDAAKATLSAAELAALSKVRWIERLKSLWAPVTVLALVFLVYLAIVETSVCTYLWLQPIMKAFGLACVLWWAVLVVLRYAWREWEGRRLARHEAEELLSVVEGLANTKRAQLKESVWSELVERSTALARALPGAETSALGEATKKLHESYDKHLVKLKSAAWLETGGGLVRALAIALLVRTVFLEPFKIPSGSMLPTLEIGDQVFVNKFIYGVRLPFTNTVPFTIVRPPKRGDVIVFNNPVMPEYDYIKRVVAIGGDTLTFQGRELRVNGAKLEATQEAASHPYWTQDASRPTAVRDWFVDDWQREEQVLLKERLDGVTHWILNRPGTLQATDGLEVKVPEGHVFVMGDNRDGSADSRFGLRATGSNVHFEYVPLGHIKGKATVIWLALGRGGLLSGVFGGTGFRTDRLFQPMELCGAELPPPMPK